MPRRRRRKELPCPAHVGPPPITAPALADEAPLLIRLERAVEERFRPAMLAALQTEVDTVDRGLRGHAPQCPDCGRPMRARGRKRASFLTRFGSVATRPRVYRCHRCRRQTRPLFSRLGVQAGRVSGSLARLLALLGVVVPYELATRLAWEFFGLRVCAMTVWRCVQRLGAACEEYLEQQARYFGSPHHDGGVVASPPDAVVLGVDGCALGMQVRPHRRRREPGQRLPPLPPVEDGQFREVKTGVLLLPGERLEPSPGRRSVVRRVLCTCLGDADQIFARLWAKLCELGWLGPATVVVIVGDGAEWIWNRATQFPQRCEILDFWHAVEYAWDFARVRYGEGSVAAAQWVHKVAIDLRAGRVAAVLARLRALKVHTPEQREALAAVIKYYDDNRSRMQYDEYLRRGYGIGSGAVESAHKQVVHARLRQAGMRWSELGAQRLLALRVLLLNDHWATLDRLTLARRAA